MYLGLRKSVSAARGNYIGLAKTGQLSEGEKIQPKTKYYQFHLPVKTRLPKLHWSRRLFDFRVCIFFTRQIESDMSIYFMPPTDHEFKDEQPKNPFIFGPS